VVLYIGNGSKIMSDSDKTKEQLIEELKALRGQSETGKAQTSVDSAASTGLTRRDVLSGWVAPVILTVPLIPRSSMAAAEGSGDFTAFPTRLDIQADDPAVGTTNAPTNLQPPTTMAPTVLQTPSTMMPTGAPTSAPTVLQTPSTMMPTSAPTSAPTVLQTPSTMMPTQQPTSSPTIMIPVELTEFEVNG
jgi:hypothetical protein